MNERISLPKMNNNLIRKRSFGTVIDLNSPPYHHHSSSPTTITASKAISSDKVIAAAADDDQKTTASAVTMNKKTAESQSIKSAENDQKISTGKQQKIDNLFKRKAIDNLDTNSDSHQDRKCSKVTISSSKRRKTKDDKTVVTTTAAKPKSKPTSSNSIPLDETSDQIKLLTDKNESDEYLRLIIEERFKAIEETWAENDRLGEEICQLRLENDQLQPICEQIIQFHELVNNQLDELSD